MKIIETKIQKRFADIDVFRHVNNVHQQEYLDLGKTDYYQRVLGLNALDDSPTLMIVSVKTDFLEQVRWQDDVAVRTRVERIGTKSITLHQTISVHSGEPASSVGQTSHAGTVETVCTDSRSVLVCYDRRRRQTIEVPAVWREKITEME